MAARLRPPSRRSCYAPGRERKPSWDLRFASRIARRLPSIVAPQAFTLLNSALLADASTAMASRVEKASGSDPDAQTVYAFRLALQRTPDATERAACVALCRKRGLPSLCRALLNVNEFVFVD